MYKFIAKVIGSATICAGMAAGDWQLAVSGPD